MRPQSPTGITLTQGFFQWHSQLSALWDETRPAIHVCDGTSCRALGSQTVLDRLREALSNVSLDINLQVIGTGCPGFCECGPLITIYPQRISYQKVKVSDIPQIIQTTLLKGQIIDLLIYRPSKW